MPCGGKEDEDKHYFSLRRCATFFYSWHILWKVSLLSSSFLQSWAERSSVFISMVPVRQVDKIEFHTCRKGNPNKRQRMTSWRTSVPFSFSICTGGQNYRPHHMFIKEESSCFWCLWGLWNLVYQNSVGQLKENLHPTKIPWYKISIPCLKRHHKTSNPWTGHRIAPKLCVSEGNDHTTLGRSSKPVGGPVTEGMSRT